jgi:V8-like Glu-specific endopeptidase
VSVVLTVRDGGARPRARSAIGIALAAGLASALAAAPGAAQTTAGTDGLAPADKPADVRAYWTPERMRAAIPAGPLGGEAVAAKRRGGGSADKVNRPSRVPNRTHGKVFFRDGATNYVCSGTSLRSPSQSVVWTAGHCVYGGDIITGGKFFDDWMFAPAYRNGKTPYGEWTAKDLAATSQWKSTAADCPPGGLLACGNVGHDFGAAVVGKRGGQELQQRVGGRGIVFGSPRDQVYRPYGYPADPPFNGERMYKCRSSYQGADTAQGNPKPMRINCDMTGGSSGGGWVTAGGDVASVVSYGYTGEENNLYGPYQAGSARELYEKVKGG